MGWPSYAHPIIGECWLDATSSPLTICKSLSPYNGSPSWLLANTDSLRTLGAYKWEYWRPRSGVNSCAIYPSSPLTFARFLSNKLTLQLWRIGFTLTPEPGKSTEILVDADVYPLPPWITLTSVISLFSNTGVITAPIPSPVIVNAVSYTHLTLPTPPYV